MAWRLAHSLTRLRDQVNAAYPNRSKASDGTIGDAAHAASSSDHNPNSAGVVTALDLTNDPANGFDVHQLAERVRLNPHPDAKYIISNGRIAGIHTGWQWRNYTGSNPHSRHAHFSVGRGPDGRSTAPYDNKVDWPVSGGVVPKPSPAPQPQPGVIGVATVTVPVVNVRQQPTSASAQAGSRTLRKGQTFNYVAIVLGQSVGGNPWWLKSQFGNYVWLGGTNVKAPTIPKTEKPVAPRTATALRVANVRVQPNTSAPLGGSQRLEPGQTFQYTGVVQGQRISQNGVTTADWLRSTKGNFVWAGNVRR
jgi:hypothetical protein